MRKKPVCSPAGWYRLDPQHVGKWIWHACPGGDESGLLAHRGDVWGRCDSEPDAAAAVMWALRAWGVARVDIGGQA